MRGFAKRRLAMLLSAALLLSAVGCQSGGNSELPDDSEAGYETVSQEDLPSSAPPYASEFPSIDATIAFPGEVVAEYVSAPSASEELRAVWISYLELNTMLTGKSAAQFRANIGAAMDNVKSYGLNTVIIQVRPFADALYDSDYFPWSYIATGTEGKDPGFDPLQVMVEEAASRKLRVEAWINPYRVRAKGSTKALAADNQAKKWIDAGSSAVIQYDGAITYNPASADARNLIIQGVTEIVRKYDIDGIHLDDYFYPTTDSAYDKASYTAYQNGGGKLSLGDWRRSNVETLLKECYQAVKKVDESCVFGISPQSSVNNNYTQQFLDVEKVASTPGYCDYICPQIYFGYNNDAQPYKKTLQQWNDMVKDSPVDLYVGLAVYKVGSPDSWAGSGKNEWVNNQNLLSKMVGDARVSDNCSGFVLYRYDSLFQPEAAVAAAVGQERSNLQKLL